MPITIILQNIGNKKFLIDHRVRHALEILKLPRNVTENQLKLQYHRLAKVFHPDMQNIRQSQGLSSTSSKVKNFDILY